jgi:signal transduction histidine kinase
MSPRSRQQLRQLQAGLRSLASTVNTVLAFYHPAELRLERLELAALLDWAGSFLVPLTERAQMELQVAIPPCGLAMMADRTQLEQALLNLVVNACQHGAAGDVVALSAGWLSGEARHLALKVIDTGRGIPEPLLARVFEPSFTTKPAGTGLGLAVVRRIVEQHQGMIRIESKVNGGTTVSMIFPAAPVVEREQREEWDAMPGEAYGEAGPRPEAGL